MKIGILGGTFDPVHRGHSYIAAEVLRIFRLDRVLFLVARRPPHKGKQEISGPFHRYAMVVLEIWGQEPLFACPWELMQEKTCYTIQTLDHFASCYPRDQFCFIAGTDSLKEIHLWREYGRLFQEHCLIFVQRPGAEVDLEQLQIPHSTKEAITLVDSSSPVPAVAAGRSYLIHLNPPPVSSTAIRRALARGEALPKGSLSPVVYEYIRKYKLYEKNQEGPEKDLRDH